MRRCPYCGYRHRNDNVLTRALLWAAMTLGTLGVLVALQLFTG